MEVNTTIISITTAKNSALGGSVVFSSMIVFQDLAYFIVAGVGAFVSLFLAWYDVVMEKRESTSIDKPFIKSVYLEVLKAMGIGFLVSFLLFLGLTQAGDVVIAYFFPTSTVPKIMPSLAMAITLFLSTRSVMLWNKFSNFILSGGVK